MIRPRVRDRSRGDWANLILEISGVRYDDWEGDDARDTPQVGDFVDMMFEYEADGYREEHRSCVVTTFGKSNIPLFVDYENDTAYGLESVGTITRLIATPEMIEAAKYYVCHEEEEQWLKA